MSGMRRPRRLRTLLPALVLAVGPAALAQAAPAAAPEAAAEQTSPAVRRTQNGTTFRSIELTRSPPAMALKTWAVADLDSGRILAVHRPNARRQPASTIKLLTSLTAARTVRPKPDHRVTWAEAHPEFCICVGLRVGRRYSRDSLMAAMLLPSANDAAEAMAGSHRRGRAAFLRAMNRHAEHLGMTRTRAINPSGLTARGAHSTARDLLVLLRAAQSDPTVAPFLNARSAPFGPLGRERRTITRENAYLERYRRAEGKTGFTTAAGYNLVVAQPVRLADGAVRRLGVAALGARSREANTRSVAALARWVRDSYAVLRPLASLPPASGPVLTAQAKWAGPQTPPTTTSSESGEGDAAWESLQP